MAEKLKTVGLDAGVWRQLKLLALENDWTLSEAVAHLLTLMDHGHSENEDDGSAPPAGSGRKEQNQ